MSHLTQITTPGQTGGRPDARPSAAAVFEARSAAGGGGAGPPAVRSLYVHIPFCFHKCHYCDFYSIVDTQERQAGFTERLIGELRALAPFAARSDRGDGDGVGAGGLRTIFVGGGTPTLLAVGLWERLLGAMGELFDLSAFQGGGSEAGEWTVECNPETVTPELMAVLAAAGVNRVSIGAQSFHPGHLKTLERWHDPDNVERAVEMARAAGIARQSVDLIFAIPGQTLAEWEADLARAVRLGTTHLSCYSLTYEPNTAMTARLKAGQFTPADEDLEAEMLLATAETLRGAGFARYEVSNFARGEGSRSEHNLVYWRQGQWLAAGPSASGHVWAGADPSAGGWRWKNVPRLGDYLGTEGFSPVVDVEAPEPARALRERLMMGLRISEGLEAESVLRHSAAVSAETPERLLRMVRRFREEGLMRGEEERWRLTERAVPIADFVAGKLMGVV